MSNADKDRGVGTVANLEEIDIFTNPDYVQAEQIMTSDTLVSGKVYWAFCGDEDDNTWAYGETSSDHKVHISKVTTGGASNPGAFASAFNSSDATYLASKLSPIMYHPTSQTNKKYLYYVGKSSADAWMLTQYDITAGTATNNDAGSSAMTLDGMGATYARPWMVRMYGTLYVGNGRYVASVDKDGVFTAHAFTLPLGMITVDMESVSDISMILARSLNPRDNKTYLYFWDLEEEAGFIDESTIPMGGAQWIASYNGMKVIFCASNGIGKFYLHSGQAGTAAKEIPGKVLYNVATETSTQPVSLNKMLATKDGILYFAIYKTDKTGIYALGQLDADKPLAFLLSKRFDTSSYAAHIPYAIHIQGSNFYGAYSDNGTDEISRCETLNSPTRSSNAIIETHWFDNGEPYLDKKLVNAYVSSYPLTTGTAITLSVATDYSSSYTQRNRPDDTIFNTLSGLLSSFLTTEANKKAFKLKTQLTSNGSSSPKLQTIGLKFSQEESEATK